MYIVSTAQNLTDLAWWPPVMLLRSSPFFLIFFFTLKSFHLLDSDSMGQSILRGKVIVLHAGEMTSVANYEVFGSSPKNQETENSTQIPEATTNVALIAELDMFTHLRRYFSLPRSTNYVYGKCGCV